MSLLRDAHIVDKITEGSARYLEELMRLTETRRALVESDDLLDATVIVSTCHPPLPEDLPGRTALV